MSLSLAKKFIVSLGFVLFVLFLITAAWSLYLQRQALGSLTTSSNTIIDQMFEEQSTERIESEDFKIQQITKLLAAMAPASVAAYELTNLQHFASVTAKDPNISYVEFKDIDGHSLAVVGEKKDKDSYIEEDIIYEEIPLGKVVLGYNHEWTTAKIAEAKKRTESRFKELDAVKNSLIKKSNASLGIGLLLSLMTSLILLGLLVRTITKPLATCVTIANQLAEGNFSTNIAIKQNDELGILATALKEMKNKIHAVLSETDRLIRAVQEGRLELRGNVETFSGDWRELIVGLNNVIDAFVSPITMTAATIDQIAQGDIPDKITDEYKGDFNKIKDNLNMLIDAMDVTTRIAEAIADGNLDIEVKERSKQDRLMKALNMMLHRLNKILQEMKTLVQSVQGGNLMIRGEVEAFDGGWRDLAAGVNSLIDAFVAPIMVTATALDRIAKGDIPDNITEEYQGDFNAIKQNLNLLIEATNAITRLAEEMAAGNLTVEIKERSEQDTLMQVLKTMLTKLNEVVLGVKATTTQVATGSQGMRTSSEEMSQGAAQQASAAEEASSSMEKMAANIRQNAENALQTEKIAVQSAQYAEESGRVVAETVIAMQQIAKKIAIIREIADQTRMLSLNATIEAVRAQEHGKAFSVVASEVRKLSAITKTAAEKIDELASSSMEVAKNAGQMLERLVPNIHKTAELVQEISAASNEQSSGTEQINNAIQQLDQVTQQNVLVAEDVAVAAEKLAAQAEQLRNTMTFFRIAERAPTRPAEGVSPPSPEQPGTITEHIPKSPTHPDGERIKEDEHESPAGYFIVISENEEIGDERDAEFERY